MYFNARSICNKIHDLNAYTKDHSPDIILICETWMTDKIPSLLLGLNQFTIYRRDRNPHAGGILIAIRNNVKSKIKYISQKMNY